MKILIIPNNIVNNCFGVRNKLPAQFLEQRGHEIRVQNDFRAYMHPKYGKTIDPAPIDWADTVVFNRHYDVDINTLRNLMTYAKMNGKKVIYETDDLLEALNFSNPMYQQIQYHVAQVRMMASIADVCTTTGEEIQKELLKYNSNVQILPNCVDPEKWTLRKGGNKKIKVGYAGGSSHSEDLLMILDVVKDLQEEIDFEFTIFGLAPIAWEKFIANLEKRHAQETQDKPNLNPAEWYAKTMELDKKLKEIKWKQEPFVPIEEYNQKLSELNFDIGLCPLVDTKFNRCKSAIKFYEYAMVGTACLASKIPPYEGEVNYNAKNKHDKWKTKLRNLVQDEKLRDFITIEQREWVLKNRDIRSNIHLWEQAYNN